jgi:hypothetical protein
VTLPASYFDQVLREGGDAAYSPEYVEGVFCEVGLRL